MKHHASCLCVRQSFFFRDRDTNYYYLYCLFNQPFGGIRMNNLFELITLFEGQEPYK